MLLKIYPENPNRKEIDKVVHSLNEGGLVIYPTDTVYAMGCNALNVRAVEKICKLKGINPDKNNLSIICQDLTQVSEYAKIDDRTFKLLRKNLPGAFTFILNTNSNLPKIYKNRKTVGVRVPNNRIVMTMLEELGNPIMTTSLKNEDEEVEYITDPELIYEKYNDQIDVIVDGGYGDTEASTIVDCTGDEPIIIRQGKGELIL